MTLAKFQRIIKRGLFIVALILYGIGSFTLGKATTDFGLGDVRGISTDDLKKEVIEKPLPYADIQAASIVPKDVKLCANTEKGFEIAYPSDWFTTYNQENQKCTFFAPHSFVIQKSPSGLARVEASLAKYRL